MELGSLYKFRSLNIESISSFANKEVWFADQNTFNDPFEGIYVFDENYCLDELTEYLESIIVKENNISLEKAKEVVAERKIKEGDKFEKITLTYIRQMHKVWTNNAKAYSILSMSADVPGYRAHVANMLMWSHYGNGLKGFCVEFDGDKLYESLKQINDMQIYARTPINYRDRPKEIKLIDGCVNNGRDYVEALQVKHKVWEYEGEHRIISKKVGLHKYAEESVKTVYIGERMPVEEENLLIGITKANYPNALIKKVAVDNRSYSIKIGDLKE